MIYQSFVKRQLDVIFAAMLLIFLSVPLLLVSLLILITQGRPIFYIQRRVGKNERIFSLVKFRTMKVSNSQEMSEKDDELRVTKLGSFLRKTSIDELPELINILKGDMSFIGPRPLPESYLPYFTPEENRRHQIFPGLTGLAQVNGRNQVSWENRFSFDLQYLQCVSFGGDLKIFLKTISYVLAQRGIETGIAQSEGNLAKIRQKN